MKNHGLVLFVLILLLILMGCNSHSTHQTDGLPSLYVMMSDDDLDSILHDKKYKAPAFVTLVTSVGDTLLCDSIDNIHTRGNTTFKHEKKPFTIKLRKKTKVLGLDRGKRYVLFANAFDESYIRNAVAFDLADVIGLKAPKYSYLSLYINSKYRGLYQITNKIEDIMDFGRDGFLMEGNSHVELPRHLSDEERDSIVRKYKKIESYIEECADCDACYDSLQRWMDMESFAKYYLLHEITLNMDATGPGSFFKYASNEDDGKLHAGPAWDFDKSLATIHRGWNYEWEKNEIVAGLGLVDSSGKVRSGVLLYALWKREDFRELVKDIYMNEVSELCHDYLESGRMDSLIDYLRLGAEKDYNENGGWRYFAYNEETQRVRTFLQQRLEFLDWFFATPREDMVCITYLDTCRHGDGDRIAQVWLPANNTPKLPKLLETPFNNTPVPDVLCYKGTNDKVSNQTQIKSEDEIELKWRKPTKKEVLFRRIRKKLHSWGL